MTSPTYSLSLVFGTSWKQASPQRYRQVRAERPPGWGFVFNSGSSLRTSSSYGATCADMVSEYVRLRR